MTHTAEAERLAVLTMIDNEIVEAQEWIKYASNDDQNRALTSEEIRTLIKIRRRIENGSHIRQAIANCEHVKEGE